MSQKVRRIKVFLSGVVNSTNAQNLNCRALMKYLDPNKFEVRALTVYSGDLSRPQPPRTTFEIHYPARIWHTIQLIRGILWSDVAYLCKPEQWKLQMWLCKVFKKVAFKTMEGIIMGNNLERALSYYGSKEQIRLAHAFTGNTFSITQAMRLINERSIGLSTREEVLYLGVETACFENDVQRTCLSDICLIGSSLRYKGLEDFFELARRFPDLTFHLVGSGFGTVDPKEVVAQQGLENIVAHGGMTHAELSEFLKSVQVHVFPSRAEGFPKVTLETSAAGVPNVVYGDYGAVEWIENGVSGFVVDSLDQMELTIRKLREDPEMLQRLSEGARKMAHAFDWRVRVGAWERVIALLAVKGKGE